MSKIDVTRLNQPTAALAEAFTRWENDPAIRHLSQPHQNQQELERKTVVTAEDLVQRLQHQTIFLIYAESALVGEMSYQVDPALLIKRQPKTAWIGITLGEAQARGRGIGQQALEYLEQHIVAQGLSRIELGVFEFNTAALGLYRKRGYHEIGRIEHFTYWQGRMWDDIRMEKYLAAATH